MMKHLVKIIFIFWLLFSVAAASAQAIPKWKIAELESYIKQADKPVIINFWATFCKPCLEEIPYMQKLVKKYESAGVELLLVNLDAEDVYVKLKPFAAKYGLKAPVVFLDETNADIFCPKVDESWSGAIPATLFLNNKTAYRKFFEEQLTEAKMEEEIKLLVSGKNKKLPQEQSATGAH